MKQKDWLKFSAAKVGKRRGGERGHELHKGNRVGDIMSTASEITGHLKEL